MRHGWLLPAALLAGKRRDVQVGACRQQVPADLRSVTVMAAAPGGGGYVQLSATKPGGVLPLRSPLACGGMGGRRLPPAGGAIAF